MFISFAKRRHEFATLADSSAHRESLSGYSVALLDQFLVVCTGATMLSYALYTTDEETIAKLPETSLWMSFGDSRLLLTLPLVMYGLFHYLALVQRGKATGDPSRALLTDRPLTLTVLLYGLLVVLLLYV